MRFPLVLVYTDESSLVSFGQASSSPFRFTNMETEDYLMDFIGNQEEHVILFSIQGNLMLYYMHIINLKSLGGIWYKNGPKIYCFLHVFSGETLFYTVFSWVFVLHCFIKKNFEYSRIKNECLKIIFLCKTNLNLLNALLLFEKISCPQFRKKN